MSQRKIRNIIIFLSLLLFLVGGMMVYTEGQRQKTMIDIAFRLGRLSAQAEQHE
jgi:hypothetical protein